MDLDLSRLLEARARDRPMGSVAMTPAWNWLRVIADTSSELSWTKPVPNDDFGSEPTLSQLWVLSATLDKKYQIALECVCAQL